jgi:hypothetical protein
MELDNALQLWEVFKQLWKTSFLTLEEFMSYATTSYTTNDYQQLNNLCGNVCSYNLMVITTNGLMEWMFNIMWACIEFYVLSS